MNFRPEAMAPGMVGKKYGHLTVLSVARRIHYGKVRPDGSRLSYLTVNVVCDCGAEKEMRATDIASRGVNRCRRCANEDNRIRGRKEWSVRVGGRTLAEIAASSGVPLDTVYHRFLRGWPVGKLGLPRQQKGTAKKIGGSTYVPERRRTRYPNHGNRPAEAA